MAYFKFTLSEPANEKVKARVTFPSACYTAAGGEKGVPAGSHIPPGDYAYICDYAFDDSNPCPSVDTTREWVLPYKKSAQGKILHVFLREKSTGKPKEEKHTQNVVEEFD